MLIIVNLSIKILIKGIAKLGIVWPFVLTYSRIIKVVKPIDGEVPLNKPTILAINPHRFRGDLAVLSNSKQFRVLLLPYKWQMRLLALFWSSNISEIKRSMNYFIPGDNKDVVKMQKKLRSFLKKFLKSLYLRLKVDCVVGSAVHYIRDYDIGKVSNEIGVPYIILQNENIFLNKSRSFYHKFYSDLGKFVGSHIIVQNDLTKDIIVKSGIVTPDKISTLGSLRMDEYVEKVKSNNTSNKRKNSNHRKKVTLFSISYGHSLVSFTEYFPKEHFPENRDSGFVKLFEHVHTSIARLAMTNKDIDFVIKPKWGGKWIDEIKYVLSKNNIEAEKIDNLFIIVDTNVHDLILGSDVLCAFSSSIVLESIISGKPVVVPFFDEAVEPQYKGYIQFEDSFHLMDIAHSPEEFEKLIIEKLNNPEISEECIKGRYDLFEKYLSSMNGDTFDKYARVINKIIKDRQRV